MAAFSVQDAQSRRFLPVENSPTPLCSISMGGKGGGYTYYIRSEPSQSAPAGRIRHPRPLSQSLTALPALPKGEPLAWREGFWLKCKACGRAEAFPHRGKVARSAG